MPLLNQRIFNSSVIYLTFSFENTVGYTQYLNINLKAVSPALIVIINVATYLPAFVTIISVFKESNSSQRVFISNCAFT